MKLVVLGATGRTGLEIVRQGLERGHAMTALVRRPERLMNFRDRMTIVQGDLLDASELARVVEGQDAVLSAFGPRVPVAKAEAHLLEQFANALTSAMVRSGAIRVIVESVAFLFRDSIVPPAYLLGRLLFPTTVADADAMERIFSQTLLEWTMVRPPELTDKPYTGKYRVREGHLPFFGFKIARADVANFMINAAENRNTIHKVFGICN